MLKRKIMYMLEKWQRNEKKKSLILSGARQVGKTFIVREFAKENYDSFVEINFYEKPEYKRIFSGNLDVGSLLTNISLYVEKSRLVPGRTLILLDEIQECPEAIASLKFWTQDGRFDVISTGSALGIDYKRMSSYPVGYVEYIDMYALDFEEFLWAMGVDENVLGLVSECFQNKQRVPDAVHEKMLSYLKLYMAIGGMPEVVNEYLKTKEMRSVDEVQRRIYRDYLNDIAHYASADVKIKAEKCYESIPLQLSKENHKFQYKLLENKGTSRKYETSLDWLERANLVRLAYNVSLISYPLKAYAKQEHFRVYPTDIGMLMAGFDYGVKKALLEDELIESTSPSMVLKSAKGGLYEALAADFLIKKGRKDLFFYKDEKNTMELEFLIENESGIVPLEIKAGRSKANSLGNLLDAREDILYGVKFSSQNVGVNQKKITFPLYMLMFVK